MLLGLWQFKWLEGICSVLLFFTGLICFIHALRLFPARRRRLNIGTFSSLIVEKSPPRWLLRIMMAYPGPSRLEERSQLLAGAGFRLHPLWYGLLKRLFICLHFAWGLSLWIFRGMLPWTMDGAILLQAALLAASLSIIVCDRPLLKSIGRHRSHRIIEEVYSVSNQLLYFAGSRMNLHGKLARCLPYTRVIRAEWHMLLNEWYMDGERAIARFRQRLGTDEAYSFAETLNSLRQHDDEAFYGLLKQRIQDFKEKLELIRDSRKESVSYLLFVLAGLPILYTFRIFIYPWVEEGSRLFQTLN